jgi:hypothetical protein
MLAFLSSFWIEVETGLAGEPPTPSGDLQRRATRATDVAPLDMAALWQDGRQAEIRGVWRKNFPSSKTRAVPLEHWLRRPAP